MFEFQVWLELFTTEKGRHKHHDDVEFLISDPNDDVAVDNVNDWLNVQADSICDYAELRVGITGMAMAHKGFLIASFKRIKLKTKDSANPYRWIVTV